MGDQDQTNDLNDKPSEAMEALMLEDLKAKAKLLGVSFHPAIGYEKLAEKIRDFEMLKEAGVTMTKEVEADAPKALSKGQKIKAMRDEALKLIRVNIVCMNPAKRQWNGEIISIGNANLPTQKKFVPFNTPNGYHIPQIMLDVLKDREYLFFYDEQVKSTFGVQTVRRGRREKEFAIQVLPPLTEEELKELARVQRAELGRD